MACRLSPRSTTVLNSKVISVTVEAPASLPAHTLGDEVRPTWPKRECPSCARPHAWTPPPVPVCAHVPASGRRQAPLPLSSGGQWLAELRGLAQGHRQGLRGQMQPNPGLRPLLPGPSGPAGSLERMEPSSAMSPPQAYAPPSPGSPLSLRCPRPPEPAHYPAPQPGWTVSSGAGAVPSLSVPGTSLIRRSPSVITLQPVGQGLAEPCLCPLTLPVAISY